MIHETRIIPLDGRPHVAASVRQWLGDSRGHWDNDTLVVETTNFDEKAEFRGFSLKNARLVEHFRRSGPDRLDYEFTIDDPSIYTRPWTRLIAVHPRHPLFRGTPAAREITACPIFWRALARRIRRNPDRPHN